jgi:SAM-dependent methyltransferase
MTMEVAGRPGERVNRCGACGGTGFSELPRLSPAPMVACTACGVVRLYERIAPSHAASLYARYYPEREPSRAELRRQLANPTFRHRSRRLERRCPPRWRDLLEIGCGDGNFLAHLRARGWAVAGAEIDAGSAERAGRRHGIAVHAGPVASLPRRSGGPRVVAAYHVLEHVYEPAAWLAEVRGLLPEHGLLHPQVPNWGSLTRKLTGAAWTSLVFPQHVYFYTPQTLRALLERGGFTVESLTTWDPWHGPGAVAGSLVAARSWPPPPEAIVRNLWPAAPPAPRVKPRFRRRVLDALSVPLARAEALLGQGAVVDVVARRA